MCGIAGFWSFGPDSDREGHALRMGEALRHRGPDDAGVWCSPNPHPMGGWTLVHRRLAILDLSPTGHQPMVSASGRYVVVFNGEIYNHTQLRAQLQAQGMAPAWRGQSDTETLLSAMDAWGLQETLSRSRGMFAMAVWDAQQATLSLVRDRMGEKPLYYGWVGQGAQRKFAFASELQALRALPGFDATVCPRAAHQYFQFMQVSAPHSIYRGIYKLQAGCQLACHGAPPQQQPDDPLQAGQSHGTLCVRPWWSLSDVAMEGQREPIHDKAEALDRLEQALGHAVRLQSVADVPLGTFLSGGLDSSLVTALLQAHSAAPVRTFTMGFAEADHDETAHARAVAVHLGTHHQEWIVTPQEALDAAARMAQVYTEPFADSSQIPTWMVCGFAKSHVTVALTGDGADELFAGYNRHVQGPRIARIPAVIRDISGALLRNVPSRWWSHLDGVTVLGVRRLGEKLHRLSRSLDGGTLDSLHGQWMQSTREQWLPWQAMSSSEDVAQAYWELPVNAPLGPLERMLYRDAMSYLSDDILCKVDRAAMAHSLETRAPFLDADVVSLAWRMSGDLKVRHGQGKWILRALLGRYLPPPLFDRPKSGFAVPLAQWLRGPMRLSMEDWIHHPASNVQGFLDLTRLKQMWLQHQHGQVDHSQLLWAYWMFQQWASASNRRDGIDTVSQSKGGR